MDVLLLQSKYTTMGLDMYLSKRSYVKNWSFMDKTERHSITVKKGGKKRVGIDPKRVSYIIEEVGYWRKFNALHGWFVRELADGVDNCQEIYVSTEDFKRLHEVLLKVQKTLNKARKVEKVLKDWNDKEYTVSAYECGDELADLGFVPTEGFFFGGQEIDDYFKNDVDETVDVIGKILIEIELERGLGLASDYYYRASW